MTQNDWLGTLTVCGVKPETAARWAPIFAAEVKPADFAPGELAAFLGQILHESARLERVEENLNYSVERLMAVWPKRFPTHAGARPFSRNPEALAEKVYGGRLGNTAPGDGYRYRGRGLLQVTGRDNYRAVGQRIGMDLEGYPTLMSDPAVALRASIAWWQANIPADELGDLLRITKRVNGGTHGLDDRIALTRLAGEAMA